MDVPRAPGVPAERRAGAGTQPGLWSHSERARAEASGPLLEGAARQDAFPSGAGESCGRDTGGKGPVGRGSCGNAPVGGNPGASGEASGGPEQGGRGLLGPHALQPRRRSGARSVPRGEPLRAAGGAEPNPAQTPGFVRVFPGRGDLWAAVNSEAGFFFDRGRTQISQICSL